MKRFSTVLLLLLAASVLFAASMISEPAATVNLIRNSVITVEDLNAEVERYRNAGMTDVTVQDVLQTMINDEVFIQGAERDGITINDRQIDSLYRQVFNNAVQQAAAVGQTVTEDQFQAEVIRQFGSLENYRESLKNQQILNMYLMQERGDFFHDCPEIAHAADGIFRREQSGRGQNSECFGRVDEIHLAPFLFRSVVHRFPRPLNQHAGRFDRIGFPPQDVVAAAFQDEGEVAGLKRPADALLFRGQKSDGSDRRQQGELPGKRTQIFELSIHAVEAFVHSVFRFQRL